MNVLLIDNNDSFTYNIVGLLKEIENVNVEVKLSSNLCVEDVDGFDKIIISPGPGIPDDFPILKKVLRHYQTEKSMLGICLGHQTICEYWGGCLVQMSTVSHGEQCSIKVAHESCYLYKGLPELIKVGLYHSWAIEPNSITSEFVATGISEKGILMSVSHKEFDIHGVQFHPESFMTERGAHIVRNFLKGRKS